MQMAATRTIRKVLKNQATIEGAGVHLQRVFGYREVPQFDPFLLLDDFRSDNPDHYLKGFPWHPHRGIETITYVLDGEVEHGDSLGNKGIINSGDVQWMSAGSGIIHQEMPKGDENGTMNGFQLWANLPSAKKMMPPRYQEIKSTQIPKVELANGTSIKIICGEVSGVKSPVQDIIIDPEYLDVSLPAHATFRHPTKKGHTVFAYVIEDKGYFCEDKSPFPYEGEGRNSTDIQRDPFVSNGEIVLFKDGDQVIVSTEGHGVRFLLVSGKPIGEPVAWYGPMVMNTQEEIETALREFQEGTFIKHKG